MPQLYTPFLAKAGAAIGRGLEKRGENIREDEIAKLASSAYMGDPQALQQLMQIDPQRGFQVGSIVQKRKEGVAQQQLEQTAREEKKVEKEEKGKVDKRTRFNKELKDFSTGLAKFNTYEEAKEYGERMTADLSARYPNIMSETGDDAVFDEEDFNLAKKLGGKAGKTDEVQSSKIMPGGGVQQVMKSGEIRYVEPEEENVEKIKEAEKRGAELQGLRAGERGAGSSAIKQSVKAFEKMAGVRKTISLYDEGIRLLEKEGANTGPIAKMFPSFKSAAVELDNVQANLGLNVIQNTTFGSLSEQELKFALDSTMPQGLDGPQLIDWMKRKREAQMKLSVYLEDAAVFLGTPGNTIADFIRQQKTKQFVGSEEKPMDEKLTPEEQAELKKLRQEFPR